MKGTDHTGFFEFISLQKLQKYIETIPLILGSFDKKVEDNVRYSKQKLMKSLTSSCNIKKRSSSYKRYDMFKMSWKWNIMEKYG